MAPLARSGRRRTQLAERLPRWLMALRPVWWLATILILGGLVNISTALRQDFIPFFQVGPISQVSQPLSVLGSSTQVILGALLVLSGIGLFWRFAASWLFSILLLAVTVGVNLVRQQFGASLILPGIILIALLLLRGLFTRRTVIGSYLISTAGIVAVFSYGSFGAYLLGYGYKPTIGNLTDAFYFTVITLATVGYGDITPTTSETRLFTISLIIVGLSIFATAIVSVLGPSLSREFERIFGPQEEPMELKDHVILAGEGSIACNAAGELLGRGITVVQIISQGCEVPLPEHPVIRGNASDDHILKEAGIDTAHMVIAAREDDGENAFISLVAKDLNPQVRVLALARSIDSIRRLRLARADMVFSPAAMGARLLANLVEGKEISSEYNDLLEGRFGHEE